MRWLPSIMLCLEFLFALWLLRREGYLEKRGWAVTSLLLLFAAFAIRAVCFNYETLDYQNFLSRWVDFFRENGGFGALGKPVGNYNIPYLYFLALFSYDGGNDLYYIKLLSVFFDVVLAYASMKLVSRFKANRFARLGSFFAILFLPTVILNGALWGQCDSIYVALALLGIYLALDDRPVLSMVCMALSFGFKLQAVFIMPVYAVLWMYGKFNWKHFLVFPLTYVLLVLPAVLFGRPFMETLTLYFSQAGSIGDGLNYNSPSVFAVFRDVQNTALASKLGVFAAFALVLALLAFAFAKRAELSDRAVLGVALLFAIGIPFLLPHMHERYFFAADILTVILAFSAALQFSPAALLVQFASLLGYYAYLKMRYLLPMRYGSAALIMAFAISLIYFILGFVGKNIKNNENEP